jgi:sugar phosphate isomerase/epimerase
MDTRTAAELMQSIEPSMGNFIPGLVSVTFRKLLLEEVVSLAFETGLKSIEWGGDIHVPHGNLAKARRACQLCGDAGIAVSAYGSYYRCGLSDKNAVDFVVIIDTARELGTDSIRVWAGNVGSASAPIGFREAVVADIKRICVLAAQADCSISLEFHGATLTDSADSTLQLLREVAEPNLSSYWQPPVGMSPDECVASLRQVLPYARNLHVFHWWPDKHYRLPLSDGADCWKRYIQTAAEAQAPRHASLEFVRNDDPEQLKADAKTLLHLLNPGPSL